MTNPHGTPIWYELLSADPDASKAFYDAVIGWTVQDRPTIEGVDYRMIDTGGGDLVGGVLRLDDAMRAAGARPSWLFYIGVDDVDATAGRIEGAGGRIHVAPWTIEGVGRMAMCADPQGVAFYIMRGASDEDSRAWDPAAMGKCSWNELATTDQPGAHAFYGEVFGWTFPDKMPMGEMGDYVFVAAAGETIGATMTKPPQVPVGLWQFYFRARDIDAAARTVAEKGGQVLAGPMEVPGGDRIIVALDPDGAPFGVVAADGVAG